MRRSLLLLALIACGNGDDVRPAVALEGNTPSSGGSLTPPEPCRLSFAPRKFSLPVVPGFPLGAFHSAGTTTVTCINGRKVSYELRDMNGDRRPDLVMKSACDDPTVGPLAWLVYLSDENGFAANPTRFPLPLPRPPTCVTEQLLDVDGDLAPDLVITNSCLDSSVGTTRWFVHHNNGAGFDARSEFHLPTATKLGAFTQLTHEPAACPGLQPAYRAFDLDGDRKLDLVITTACEDAHIGTFMWRVHRGTGTGFEDVPTLFPLPTSPAVVPGSYADTVQSSPPVDCSHSDAARPARSFKLLDLDGDFAPELLLTSLCSDPFVGSTRWMVYRNQKTGFSPTPETISLPVIPGSLGVKNVFSQLSGPAACDQHRPEFSLLDATADDRRDLLVTRACGDSNSGLTRWLVYPSAQEGFGEARGIAIPPSFGTTAGSRLQLHGESSCEGIPRPSFIPLYLDGPQLSLVVTRTCHDASVGASHWLVHDLTCD